MLSSVPTIRGRLRNLWLLCSKIALVAENNHIQWYVEYKSSVVVSNFGHASIAGERSFNMPQAEGSAVFLPQLPMCIGRRLHNRSDLVKHFKSDII